MKNYSTAIRDEFYRDRFIAVDMVELSFVNTAGVITTDYLCTGGMDIDWNGNTYLAQGQFMGFSEVSEDFDVKVGKFSVYLSAVDTTFVNRFVLNELIGQKVIIRKAFLDFSPMTLDIIDQPIIIFDGQIYNVSVRESSTTSSLTVECSTLFADFERTAGRKTNNGSNWLYQGCNCDTSMEKSGFVGATELKWGRLT